MASWPVSILIYGAGDAASRFPGLQTDIERQLAALLRVATNQHVAAIAQLDRTTGLSTRWLLDSRNRVAPTTLGETNTGDPSELVDFISWSNSTYPADRHVLVLSGHGMAWQDEKTRRVLKGRGVVLPTTTLPTIAQLAKRFGWPPRPAVPEFGGDSLDLLGSRSRDPESDLKAEAGKFRHPRRFFKAARFERYTARHRCLGRKFV
jgi:hypothetical protein